MQLATMAVLVFGILVIAYVAWSAAYVVDAHEQAVVLRFGKYHSTQTAGLHFKIPIVDERVLVDMSEKSMRLPWGHDERAGDEGRQLAGDVAAARRLGGAAAGAGAVHRDLGDRQATALGSPGAWCWSTAAPS